MPIGRRKCSPACRQGIGDHAPVADRLACEWGSSRRADAHQPRRHLFWQPAGRRTPISRTASSSIGRRSNWAGTSSVTKCRRLRPRSISSNGSIAARKSDLPIGVIGVGEGGLLALYAAAIDRADRCGAGLGLLPIARASLGGADLSQRVGIAHRVWRRRDRQPDRAAAAGDRSVRGTGSCRSTGRARKASERGRPR